MEKLNELLDALDGLVWGPQLLIPLLFGTGLVLTLRLKGVQFSKLGAALSLGLIRRKDTGAEGDLSHYQALTTALAATVGVGNIVGVSTAICMGGPGALFWMWVTGLLGMASKYAEAFLGSKYRETDSKGEVMGGPQVYLQRAIKGKIGAVLAISFAVFGALAAFGIGNLTQVNSVVNQVDTVVNGGEGTGGFVWPKWGTGIIVMIFVGLVLIGGITWIGKVTAGFVPMMIVVYLVAGLIVLIINAGNIIPALGEVFSQAFTGTAAIGGTIGTAIRYGMARGIFSNESGMGSAAIVAAAAKTTHPVRQGLVSMTQTFIDTIIVVSFTGLVILTSNVWTPEGAGDAVGSGGFSAGESTSYAFANTLHSEIGPIIVAICIAFFALSTILGWSYYGERCAVRLLGMKAQLPYRVIFTAVIVVGSVWELQTVWTIADILNGLMALPNLVGLLILSGMIARETREYLSKDPKLTRTDVAPGPLLAYDVTWVPAAEVKLR